MALELCQTTFVSSKAGERGGNGWENSTYGFQRGIFKLKILGNKSDTQMNTILKLFSNYYLSAFV